MSDPMSDPKASVRSTPSTRELDIERRILRARSAAIDALEQGNWDAVVLSCGKVLQEVARNELPYNEHGGTLPQLLERLARRLQTDQPVSDLAAALKDAGGLRGFFDLEADVDEELARATLSVIESFLTYTYAFREEVRKLNELAAERRASTGASTGDSEAAPAVADRSSSAGSHRPSAERTEDVREPSPREAQPEASREDRKPAEAPRNRRPTEDRRNSVFDTFEDRKDDPIRQTWRPPRSED